MPFMTTITGTLMNGAARRRWPALPTAAPALAISAALLAPTGAANADPITVYAGTDPTALTKLNASSTGFLSGTATGTNITIGYSASGTPGLSEPTLDTTSIAVNTNGNAASPFYVAIVETGLTSPPGVNNFLSAFSATGYTGGVTSVTLTTEISASNAVYGGTVLATTTYTASGAAVDDVDATPLLLGAYSETARFTKSVGPASASLRPASQSPPSPPFRSRRRSPSWRQRCSASARSSAAAG
jgi:hypothetical protein